MKKGFTLIELIVVIAIIAILAAIISVNAFKAIEKAKISQMISDFKTLKTGYLALYADVGRFPTDTDYGPNVMVKDTDVMQPVIFTTANGWDGPYLSAVPKQPWGGVYRYDFDNDCYPIQNTLAAGVNVFWRVMESPGMASGHVSYIVNKADMMIDGGDGILAGAFRVENPDLTNPANPILYLIYDGC